MPFEPFEELFSRYDSRYERHRILYENELKAIKALGLDRSDSIELGVGSGRFASPLGIPYGLDPSFNMLKLASSRGIEAIGGFGERTPFVDKSFRNVLIAFTICFADDPHGLVKEAFRISRSYVVIAFVPKESPWGRYYESLKDRSPFYKVARFYTVEEVLRMAGKEPVKAYSTLFSRPMEEVPEEPREGIRKNAGFVAIAFQSS